jgi:terminase small subunit / prophage DNA-packing protein
MAALSEVAAHLGVSLKYMNDLIAKGYIQKKDRGKYDIDECRTSYISNLREMAAGRTANGELDLSAERARLAKEQADAKEMENMVERGDLLYIDDIIKDFEEQLINCKTKLLAAPTKVAAEAFAAKDVQEVQTIFEQAVKDALSELVGYRQKEAA